jgi:site-specific DNA recombinase
MPRRNEKDGGDRSDTRPMVRCAIYTRKSTDENLDSDFNSLDAQRESGELYIRSQAQAGWVVLPEHYDDAAYSGATVERPALQRLLAHVVAGKIDTVVIYKIDRFSRSLIDFTKLIATLEAHDVSLVSVTQQFNTTTSMGRLTLNILLSFAQFEREVTAERIRDKMGAARRRGKYIGGIPPLGYDVDRDRKRLVVNPEEASLVHYIFRRFLQIGSTVALVRELNDRGHLTKTWTKKNGEVRPGKPWQKGLIYKLLHNPIYIGRVRHKDETYPGEHEAIIERSLWDQIQATVEQNHRRRANQARATTPAPLKGLIRCGHCDATMGVTFTRKSNKTYRYYLCERANKNGHDACPVKTVAAGTVEDTVLDQLRAVFQTPEVLAETLRKVELREAEEMARLVEERADLEGELDVVRGNAERMMRSSAVGDTTFARDELVRLDTERQRLEGVLAEVALKIEFRERNPVSRASLVAELNTLDRIWENLFPAEQQRIMRLLVEDVVVFPERLDVVLRADGLYSLVGELEGEGGLHEAERLVG